MGKNSFEKYIDLLKPVMEGLHNALGDRSEFILHDLSQLQSSVVVVVGNVTDRQIGAPTTNLVIDVLETYGNEAKDMLGYLSVSKDGRQLKSYTIFIRDDEGEIIGCFCFNIDLTDFKVMESLLEEFTFINDLTNSKEDVKEEVFAQEISDVVEDIIKYEINDYSTPVPHMNRGDKLAIVNSLEEKGIFDVKGGADTVAHYLGVSIFTVYNYLKEVRSSYRNGQNDTNKE